jgi:hypothetical protein
MAWRDEEEPEVLDTYMGKRIVAYFIDLIIFIAPGPVLLALGLWWAPPMGLEMGPVIGIVAGVVSFIVWQYLYFCLAEGFGRCTIGTRIVGLEVALEEPPEDVDDAPIGGKAFVRNAPKLIIIGGIMTLIKNPALGCYFRPFTEPEVIEMKPKRAWTPTDEEEDLTLREELPFPEELLSGHCPKCGTPYRLDAEEGAFSGLWNYRCTWCNYPVFDHWHERRTMPGFM